MFALQINAMFVTVSKTVLRCFDVGNKPMAEELREYDFRSSRDVFIRYPIDFGLPVLFPSSWFTILWTPSS